MIPRTQIIKVPRVSRKILFWKVETELHSKLLSQSMWQSTGIEATVVYCLICVNNPWEIADWTILTIMKNTMQWNSGSKIWQNRHIQTARAPLRILNCTRNPTKQLVGDLMLVDVLIWWSYFWCCSELYTALVRWKRQTARAEKKTQIMDLVCNDR